MPQKPSITLILSLIGVNLIYALDSICSKMASLSELKETISLKKIIAIAIIISGIVIFFTPMLF